MFYLDDKFVLRMLFLYFLCLLSREGAGEKAEQEAICKTELRFSCEQNFLRLREETS